MKPNLVVRGGGVSLRVAPRTIAVIAGMVLVMVAAGLFALSVGDYQVPLGQVVTALFGDAARNVEYVVVDLRLPRLLTALLVGMALGTSGAVFQSLTRNPLGSPDVIGCTQGSATGALLVILVTGGGAGDLTVGAIVGGLVSAGIVVVLSYRTALGGYRLVLVGIGLSATLLALNNFLLTRANLQSAQVAQAWLIGTLNVRGWDYVWPMALVVAVLVPAVLALGRTLLTLELGDDTAAALGISTRRSRLVLVLLGAMLAAAATAAVGPVTFVALAAPRIARGLTRSAGPTILASALAGAVLLAVSDIAAQRLFAPTQFPVGIATGAVGGLYLIWLLARQWRTTRV